MLWKGLSQRRCVWWNPFKNKLLVHIHTLRVVHGYTKKLELAEGQIQIGSKCLSSCASGPFDTKTLPWKYLKKLSFGMYSVKYFGEQIWVPMLGYRWKSVLFVRYNSTLRNRSTGVRNCFKFYIKLLKRISSNFFHLLLGCY